jgi:hypothetical protein
MGIVYLEYSDLEKAAEFLKKSLKINPKYVPSIVAMGNLLFESGHSKTAIKYFK